jgi:DNA-binding NarL/FixJ family response regulator
MAAKRISPNLQILVHSGNADTRTHRQMLAAGADDYVIKTGRTRPLLDGLARAASPLQEISG